MTSLSDKRNYVKSHSSSYKSFDIMKARKNTNNIKIIKNNKNKNLERKKRKEVSNLAKSLAISKYDYKKYVSDSIKKASNEGKNSCTIDFQLYYNEKKKLCRINDDHYGTKFYELTNKYRARKKYDIEYHDYYYIHVNGKPEVVTSSIRIYVFMCSNKTKSYLKLLKKKYSESKNMIDVLEELINEGYELEFLDNYSIGGGCLYNCYFFKNKIIILW